MATGPLWGDPSKLTLYALSGHLPSLNPGDHAGWTALAWVWLRVLSWLDPVQAAHLLSVVAGALAVALVHRFAGEVTGDARRAGGAAAVVLVAHPVWWSAAVAESYAAALALALSGCVFSLRRGWVGSFGAGFAVGLAAAAHMFSLVVSLPWLVTARRPWQPVVGGVVAGLSPVWLGVLGTPPDPLTGFAAGGSGSWGWHLAAFVQPMALGRGVVLLAAVVVLALGPLGVWALARAGRDGRSLLPGPRGAGWVLAGYAVILCVYAPYRVPLMASFLLVGLVLLRPPALAPGGRALHIGGQVLLLTVLPWTLSAVGAGDLGLRRLPERSNARYFLSPVKRFETGPERYAQTLFEAAPQRAVILSDFNPGALLRLVQHTQRLRPDVEVIPTAVDDALARSDPAAELAARIRELGATRPVVLADDWGPYYRTEELRRRFGVELLPSPSGWLVATDGVDR